MPMKSFRGKITDGGIDTVPLRTNTGSIGYRIKSFEIMSATPGVGDVDHVVKIYTIPQSTATASVDFADNTLLGAAFLRQDADATNITARFGKNIVFDNITFNQDIYVTLKNARSGSVDCNYYIQLEQISLSLDENTVATLKDIRNIEQPSV